MEACRSTPTPPVAPPPPPPHPPPPPELARAGSRLLPQFNHDFLVPSLRERRCQFDPAPQNPNSGSDLTSSGCGALRPRSPQIVGPGSTRQCVEVTWCFLCPFGLVSNSFQKYLQLPRVFEGRAPSGPRPLSLLRVFVNDDFCDICPLSLDFRLRFRASLRSVGPCISPTVLLRYAAPPLPPACAQVLLLSRPLPPPLVFLAARRFGYASSRELLLVIGRCPPHFPVCPPDPDIMTLSFVLLLFFHLTPVLLLRSVYLFFEWVFYMCLCALFLFWWFMVCFLVPAVS